MTAYIINQAGPNGQWMQSTRVINRGEDIISEVPLVSLRIGLNELYNSVTFWNKRVPYNGVQAVERAVDNLKREARDLFDNLHNCNLKEGKVVGTILTNVFMEDEEEENQTYKVLILYNEISRVNHSCRPNAELHRNPKTKQGSLHALRQITVGEEILIGYLSDEESLKTRNERHRELKGAWGFTCRCDACLLRGNDLAADNDGREEALRLRQELDKPLRISNSPNNRDQQMMARLRQADGYIARLKQLNMIDSRLAWGYEKLAAIHSELYDGTARTRAHCADCECHRSPDGAKWYLHRASGALSLVVGLDIYTHGAGHPRVDVDGKESTRISTLLIHEM